MLAQMEVAPASRAARTTVAIAGRTVRDPGHVGAIPTLASIPRVDQGPDRPEALARWGSVRVRSGARCGHRPSGC